MAGNKMNKQRAENREQNTSQGFTLVEVMIAFVVLLLGMLGVLSMQYYAITGNAASRELRIATNLSQEIIEQIKSTPYNNLAAINPRALPADATFSGGVIFTRRWWTFADCVGLTLTGDNGTCNAGFVTTCASDPDGAEAVQVSAVRARTCWTDRNGINHSVTLDSLRWNEDVVP
jgi:prepilin-type N-terminal cleavage/methylation domain-containing protein